MPKKKTNPTRLVVDGLPYTYCVRQLPYDETGAVPLRVTIRAEYGTRSVCMITGLQNRERWHDYPTWNQELVIAVTPKVVCELVQYAHCAGWDPSNNRANLTIAVENSFLSRPVVRETDAS